MLLRAPTVLSALLVGVARPIPRAAIVAQYGQQYVEAVYESPADAQPGDLSFQPGDVIAIVRPGEPDGWWEGFLNGVTGVYPATFCSAPWTDVAGGTIMQRIRARMVAAMKQGAAGSQEVLALRQMIAVCTRKRMDTGLEVLHDEDAIEALSKLARSLPKSETFLLGLINEFLPAMADASGTTIGLDPVHAAALYVFQASRPDELSLRPGNILEVLDTSNPDWWTGSLHGETGVFPANFVAVIESDGYLAC